MRIISIILPLDIKISCQDVFYRLNITKKPDYICFLDSSLYPNKYSSFSYIAWEADFAVRGFIDRNEVINTSDNSVEISGENPLIFLKKVFRRYIFQDNGVKRINNTYSNFITGIEKLYIDDDGIKFLKGSSSTEIREILPDFMGGFIGYISYDLKNYIEKLPQTVIDDIKNPLFYFIYYSKLISYSHKNCKWYLICNFNLKDCHDSYCDSIIYKNSISGLSFNNINNAVTESIFSESVNYRNSGIRTDISVKENKKLLYRLIDECIYQREKIASILDEEEFKKAAGLQGLKEVYGIKRLKESVILDLIVEKYLNRQINSIKLKSNFTKKEYLKAVLKAKEYIHNGDIYQVNMTQRFTSDLGVEPYDLYYILRQKNAAPFSAYLGFPELKVGSSSPERFLFLKEGMIETRPIKGTRPRGIDRIEDYRFINELKNSTKDRAELNMIVDLERNDLGRFCEYGTVKVKEHAVIEKYAKVFHLVSTVTGKVRKGYGIVDILKATFPGGSITGAPKIRAMEIIDELEPNVRSIYTGTIGYIGIDGTMDLNIVIRTFIIKGKRFYYNVGGGIVEDSEPYPEYQETLDKGLALKETLEFFLYKNLIRIRNYNLLK